MVIIDTSVWVRALRLPASAEKAEVDSLIASDDAAIVGTIIMELLRGARTSDDLHRLERQLDALPFLDTTKVTWMRAGELLARLDGGGRAIPLPDAVIAAHALQGEHSLYTLDDHFRRVPGLRLHEASA